MTLSQNFDKILIISSIIWAAVMIACANVEFEHINNILLVGFFTEFLLILSSKKAMKKSQAEIKYK